MMSVGGDTFVTPLCCKVFCSFHVGKNFFFQNKKMEFQNVVTILKILKRKMSIKILFLMVKCRQLLKRQYAILFLELLLG